MKLIASWCRLPFMSGQEQTELRFQPNRPWSPTEGILGLTKYIPELAVSIFALDEYRAENITRKKLLNPYQLVAIWAKVTLDSKPNYRDYLLEVFGFSKPEAFQLHGFISAEVTRVDILAFIHSQAMYELVLHQKNPVGVARRKAVVSHLLDDKVDRFRIANIVGVSISTVNNIARAMKINEKSKDPQIS